MQLIDRGKSQLWRYYEKRKFYDNDPDFFNWVVDFRCLNILPPPELSKYYRRMLPKARNKFNNGKKVKAELIQNFEQRLIFSIKPAEYTLLVRIVILQACLFITDQQVEMDKF